MRLLDPQGDYSVPFQKRMAGRGRTLAFSKDQSVVVHPHQTLNAKAKSCGVIPPHSLVPPLTTPTSPTRTLHFRRVKCKCVVGMNCPRGRLGTGVAGPAEREAREGNSFTLPNHHDPNTKKTTRLKSQVAVLEPETRFELVTTALRKQSSTPELLWHGKAPTKISGGIACRPN